MSTLKRKIVTVFIAGCIFLMFSAFIEQASVVKPVHVEIFGIGMALGALMYGTNWDVLDDPRKEDKLPRRTKILFWATAVSLVVGLIGIPIEQATLQTGASIEPYKVFVDNFLSMGAIFWGSISGHWCAAPASSKFQ